MEVNSLMYMITEPQEHDFIVIHSPTKARTKHSQRFFFINFLQIALLHLFILFYFISFALKNTKKKPHTHTHTHMYRYANKILGQGHRNSLSQLLRTQKIKIYKISNLNHMQQLISWSKNLAVLHFNLNTLVPSIPTSP